MKSKTISLIIIILFLTFHWKGQDIVAQNIAITDDDAYNADGSAMLDVKSLTKGMLVPRLTTSQRNAVASPANGLLIFDTDAGGFYFYNGTEWINLTSGITSGILGYTSPDKVYLADVNDKLGVGTTSPFGKMEVKSDIGLGVNDPIFQVINNNGDTVFAVYQQGVRVNVEDSSGKANTSKGGFAVGGFSPSKGTFTNEFLRVTPDSVRIYIEDDPAKANTSKGGFAVGGFSPSKTSVINYMDMTPINYFIGHESGLSVNVTGGGIYNNFFGYQAGKYTNTGYRNNAIGYNALFSNTSGYDNVANGYQALYSNIGGSFNVSNGFQALYYNTGGFYNVANGYQALFYNNNNSNVANGYQALYNNSSGDANTAEGYQALYNNTSGRTNVAIGNLALWSNTTQNANVAIGDQAAYYSVGGANTSVGQWTLFTNTGSNNTALGFGAYYYWSPTSYSNSTALGAFATITASNQVRIGSSAVTSIGGQVGWTTLSDGRFKKNIKESVQGLDFILKLKPVTYNVDIDKYSEFLNIPDSLRLKDDEKIKSQIIHTGFIAQEVEEAAKSVGFDFSGVDRPKNENDYYGLRYAEFTVPLVKAVQEQQKIIEAQQSQIDSLKLNNSNTEAYYKKIESEQQKQILEIKAEIEHLNSILMQSSKK